MRSITTAALAAVALAAAGCGTGPGQITVRGQIMGVTSDSAYTAGKAFGALPSGTCDVNGTQRVKIIGSQGQELAWAVLKPGKITLLVGGPDSGRIAAAVNAMGGVPGREGTQIWTFTATVPAGQTQYGVQVGSMPPLAMTPQQITSPDLTC